MRATIKMADAESHTTIAKLPRQLADERRRQRLAEVMRRWVVTQVLERCLSLLARPPLRINSCRVVLLSYAWCTNRRCARLVMRAFAERHPQIKQPSPRQGGRDASAGVAGMPGVRIAMWHDAALHAVDRLGHLARLVPFSIMAARAKEMIRRHVACRRAVLRCQRLRVAPPQHARRGMLSVRAASLPSAIRHARCLPQGVGGGICREEESLLFGWIFARCRMSALCAELCASIAMQGWWGPHPRSAKHSSSRTLMRSTIVLSAGGRTSA